MLPSVGEGLKYTNMLWLSCCRKFCFEHDLVHGDTFFILSSYKIVKNCFISIILNIRHVGNFYDFYSCIHIFHEFRFLP